MSNKRKLVASEHLKQVNCERILGLFLNTSNHTLLFLTLTAIGELRLATTNVLGII